MKIEIRADSVTLEGYVNAVERKSKPLYSRFGRFIEKICAGAFSRALGRADDVRILLNHDENRDLGGIKDGNLELDEDNIGLHVKATITDPEVIEDARRGDLVGWSFGFTDMPNGVEETRDDETGLPFRKVKDLSLSEVSILNRRKSPAYVGTLVNVRDDGSTVNYGEETTDEAEIVELEEESVKEAISEMRDEQKTEPETAPAKTEVSSEYYARYKNIISELKELVKTNKEV